MRGFTGYMVTLALMFLPAGLAAQYVGTGRPFDSRAVLDSLAAKSDTSALRAVRSVQDSLASASRSADSVLSAIKIGRDYYKAGANVTLTTHGAPGDSATIGVSVNGGGGGGLPYDTTLYRRILGWPSDSALYGRFSGWRMLDNRTTRADSATGDSLWSSIDQLKTTGGRILVLGADTVHVYRLTAYDSLPTAGGITSTVSVYGTPRTVIKCKDAGAAPFSFTVNRPAGTGTAFLEFKNLRMIMGSVTNQMYVCRGRLRFENCDIDGGIPNFSFADGNAGDSLAVFKACRFGDVYSYISNRVGFISFENCEGNFLSSNWSPSGITQNASRFGVHIINPRNLGFAASTSSAGNFDLWITGGSIRQTGNYNLFEYCNTHASGVQFYFNPNASPANAVVGVNHSYNGYGSFEGCSFWNGGAAGASIRVTGCYFYNSPTAMAFFSGGSLNSCNVQNATTAVSANATTKIHGLLHSGCSTLISGTPAALTDTMTVY